MWYKCEDCNAALKVNPSQGRELDRECDRCRNEVTFVRMERIRSGHDFGKDEVFRCMIRSSRNWILSKSKDLFLPYTKIKSK